MPTPPRSPRSSRPRRRLCNLVFSSRILSDAGVFCGNSVDLLPQAKKRPPCSKLERGGRFRLSKKSDFVIARPLAAVAIRSLLVVAIREGYGLPRRFAPRNDKSGNCRFASTGKRKARIHKAVGRQHLRLRNEMRGSFLTSSIVLPVPNRNGADSSYLKFCFRGNRLCNAGTSWLPL